MPGTLAPDAVRLDRDLARLARDEAELDRQLAIGLASFWDRKCFKPLCRRNGTEFVREHLGIQESRARWLVRLGRYLRAVPELDRARAQRRLDASQVIELGRILKEDVPPDERRAWIDRGAQLSVRDLRKEVQSEVQRRKEAGEAVTEEPTPDPDEVPLGGWISIPVPARVRVLWHESVELARRAAGRQLTPAQAGEFICAEYLSALGPETATTTPKNQLSAELIAALNRLPDQPSVPADTPVLTAALACYPKGEVPVSIPSAPPEDEDFAPDSSIGEIEDPWKLADALQLLAAQKQRLRFELAGLLSQFAGQAYAGDLGYASFERYCCDRLGFCLRRAERLIRFRAGLDRFPKLATAYLAGRISYTAALLLLPILHRATEEVWVAWAKDRTYRDVERVTELARTFALPDANPIVFASFIKGLEEQALAKRFPGGVAEPTAFTEEPIVAPLGCALPPKVDGGPPRIVGFPEDLALAPPEHCVARIRFWLPQDVLDLTHRALDRCRLSLQDPLTPTWSVFEIILVHFILTHDTPEARELERRHEIIARDGYRCLIPGCMCRDQLEDHHLKHRGQGGCNCKWNRGSLCFCHHRYGIHLGFMRMGGFAPDDLVYMLGIHPETGRPFACYRNERRISTEEAAEFLDEWRHSLREERVPMALSAN